MKISHYGYGRNHDRSSRLKQLFSQMQLPPPKLTVPAATLMMEKQDLDLALCPKCKSNKMETVATYRRWILCAIVATKANYQPAIAAKKKGLAQPVKQKANKDRANTVKYEAPAFAGKVNFCL